MVCWCYVRKSFRVSREKILRLLIGIALSLQILSFLCWQSHAFGEQQAASANSILIECPEKKIYSSTGFQPLFDGKTLNGWTTVEGERVTKGWNVKDGVLIRSSKAGSIYTKQKFGDFELRFEWRLSRSGNSGVKYRTKLYEKGVHGGPEWLGLEYQLLDDENRYAPAMERTGAIYGVLSPAEQSILKPIGEFNSSRIIVVGSNVEHWLNEKRILIVDLSSNEWSRLLAKSKFQAVDHVFQNRVGRIQLQDHASEVGFRNIKIREIRDDVTFKR